MANHPNRGWRKRWRVDLSACTATHESGVVVKFERAQDGEFDGTVTNQPDASDIAGLPRLLSEAGDIYYEHLQGRH